ncbi:MAG: ATP-dependent Clp protease adaptor ClpS [Thermoanaerobaculia bacterium]|nr:ATP-dependent Clp protease adaptor ClpS [Thermoanaerobaculia bacterium]
MSRTEFDHQSETVTQSSEEVEEPQLYRVYLHNDDFTTMDFVVYVLRTIFRHGETEAVRLMLQVHNEGRGLAGTYTREIAETKVSEVRALAEAHEYPLLSTMEPA